MRNRLGSARLGSARLTSVPAASVPAASVPAADDRLRQLYDAHAAVLLAYAVRLTDGDRARAEDLVQETLLRAWRKLGDLDDATRPIRPWLFTVVRRLAIDAHRARRARPQEVGDAMLAAIPELDEVEQTLDRIVVTEALRSLSPDHRAVLLETYYRGRSVGEAAAALGVPPGTVKSRCYYALRALGLALAERGVTT